MKNQQQAKETHLCGTSNRATIFKRMTPLGWRERSKTAPVHKKQGVQTIFLVEDYTGDSEKRK